MSKILVVHPSRNRPLQATETARKWWTSAAKQNMITYYLALDNDDSELNRYYRHSHPALHLLIEDNTSAIEAINNTVAYATNKEEWDIVIVVSDDFNQPPYHWDLALTEALKGKSDYIVKTDDGLQPWIITLPIMDRVYYDRFGYIYNPVYQHMYSDTEMTAVGHLLGKIITLPIKFPHNHYSTGRTPKDAVNVKADATMSTGRQIFLQRLQQGFGIDNPVQSLPAYQW